MLATPISTDIRVTHICLTTKKNQSTNVFLSQQQNPGETANETKLESG
jgi:hypothetical protein